MYCTSSDKAGGWSSLTCFAFFFFFFLLGLLLTWAVEFISCIYRMQWTPISGHIKCYMYIHVHDLQVCRMYIVHVHVDTGKIWRKHSVITVREYYKHTYSQCISWVWITLKTIFLADCLESFHCWQCAAYLCRHYLLFLFFIVTPTFLTTALIELK